MLAGVGYGSLCWGNVESIERQEQENYKKADTFLSSSREANDDHH